MGEQALSIVKQAVDLALAEGVYKNTQDVVLIHNALINLKDLIDSDKKYRAYHNSLKEDKGCTEDGAYPMENIFATEGVETTSKKLNNEII